MTENKRVLILSVRFGSGHWQTALALKRSLVETHPTTKVEVVNYLKFAGFLFDIMLRLIYHDLMIRVPLLYRRFYHYSDRMTQDSLFQRCLRTCGAPAFHLYLKRKKPDLIISTYPIPAAAVSWLKQRGLIDCPLVTVITDYVLHQTWVQPGTDLYIVANEAVAEALVQRGVSPDRVASTGIPIDRRFIKNPTKGLQELLPDLPEEMQGLPLVLVINGATKFGGDLHKICHLLAELPVPHVAVVLGVRFPQVRSNLSRAVSKGPNKVYIVGFSREVSSFMAVASCLISKAGGLTVSEALAMEVPMLIYRALPCQEELNRDYLTKEGAALAAHSLTELGKLLCDMLQDEDLRTRMRDAAVRLRHPDAVSAAVRFLEPYLGLDRAEEADVFCDKQFTCTT